MTSGYTFKATRAVGDGIETDPVDVVFKDGQIIRPLSSWTRFDGTLSPEQPRVDIEPGVSMIHVLIDGRPVAACRVTAHDENWPALTVTGAGVTSITENLPWLGPERRLYGYNTGDLWGDLWSHVQSFPGSDFDVIIPAVTTEATVGRLITTTVDGVEQTIDEPYVLSPAGARDLSEVLSDIVADGVEYRELVVPNGRGVPRHVIDAGTMVGDDKTALRFAVGENVTQPIQIRETVEDNPTEVVVVAADGLPWWGVARLDNPGRARQVLTVTDPNVSSDADATARAQSRLASYRARVATFRLTVLDTPTARLFDIAPGDTIRIAGTRWGGAKFAQTCRISSITYNVGASTADVEVVQVRE